ncbi:hypothetical protein Ga0100231_005030 [Opitutaceae bacterium TAV4]|nr:hypothetical protein Ga0100231_005030 [Opitutaceae bacterium TAV4]RRK02359.1 hypothetical protein Ga0100230_004175 [Opitutaceae bacterium TAV3]
MTYVPKRAPAGKRGVKKIGVSLDKVLVAEAKERAKQLELTFSGVVEMLLAEWMGKLGDDRDARLNTIEKRLSEMAATLEQLGKTSPSQSTPQSKGRKP